MQTNNELTPILATHSFSHKRIIFGATRSLLKNMREEAKC